MNRLRELAALFQAPVQVQEAKTMMGDWQGIKGVVLDAIADLEDKLAEGGSLEAFMDMHGFSDMDNIADKDGKRILERMMVRTQQYKKEMHNLLDQVDLMVTSSDEPVTEMARRSDFSSGFIKSQRAKDMVAAFRAGEETFDLDNGDKYIAKKALNYRQLKKGMMVFASYSKYNQGAELYEILGFTDKDGEVVKYDTLKDQMAAADVTALKQFDEKHYEEKWKIVVRDLGDGEEGPFFYFFEGRIVRGSGAEPVSFIEVEKVDTVKEAKNHLGEPEQTTYAGWKRACKAKNADCWFEGDSDIAEAFVGPKPYKRGETQSIGQWEGDKGSVYMSEALKDGSPDYYERKGWGQMFNSKSWMTSILLGQGRAGDPKHERALQYYAQTLGMKKTTVEKMKQAELLSKVNELVMSKLHADYPDLDV